MTNENDSPPSDPLQPELNPQSNENVRAARQDSGYIDGIVSKVMDSFRADNERMVFYAKAMVMSTNLGDLTKVSPCHPKQVYGECRFNTEIQKRYGLVLSKDEAIKFLADFTGSPIAEAGFKRKHTRLTYEEKFKRTSVRAYKRQMLCTYAEWLYMHDYKFEPRLPRELIDILPEGWQNPAGQYVEGAE